jgi:glucose/arabinose dehydrogenase
MLRAVPVFLTITLILHVPQAHADPVAGRQPQAVEDRMVPDPPGMTVAVWASGLEVPWSVVFLPDGQTLVSERRGRILMLDRNGKPRPESYATPAVVARGEGGLMGLALDPHFPERPYLYAMMTRRENGKTVNAVVRFKNEGTRGVVDRTILDGIPAGTFHNGGRIAFGPDGMLYVGTGETGHPDFAQDKTSLAGKVLRVTPDGAVPSDNPFPDSPVFTLGHRNVQGLAWRPGTRDLYASEHGPSGEFGQHARDEINRIVAGRNYGWPLATCAAGRKELADPLVCWPNQAVAPSGAAFFDGDLFVATLRGEALIRVKIGTGDRIETIERWFASGEAKGRYGRLRDVAVGPDKALYVLTNDGCGGQGPNGGDCILRLTAR